MTFPISYLLFFFTLLTGSLLSISSTSWFGAWLGLELNLLSFIPLISTKLNSHLTEAAIKYFLVQALASTILIMSSSLYMYTVNISYTLIALSLFMKLGAAPLHFWFPQVIEGLFWPQAFILLTIQKLAPMFLISYLTFLPNMLYLITFTAILSSVVGAIGGLNLLKLRKIMAFSSINHMSWMFMAITLNDSAWLLYFLFYSIISASVIIMLFSAQSYTISNLVNNSKKSMISNFLLPMNFLSLGGLPPFLGFVPKWIMIQLLINSSSIFPVMILLASSLITLYFYLRIFMPLILLSFPTLVSSLKDKSSFSIFSLSAILSFFNLFGILFPLPFFV
uniref:NADH-ubiquinone oxidoreductase chain 2 n=1 Tax=Lupocycloporus gracilimanus TaxID=412131 RepID=A0A3G5BTL0_9EUCA|nr:NADH dehydrogenase subunit 2 [Lupocycloporus gracilimanus]AYW03845.1 NADH dehydrogenase subunit 2 [Lupocycloporus gracilimanus]